MRTRLSIAEVADMHAWGFAPARIAATLQTDVETIERIIELIKGHLL